MIYIYIHIYIHIYIYIYIYIFVFLFEFSSDMVCPRLLDPKKFPLILPFLGPPSDFQKLLAGHLIRILFLPHNQRVRHGNCGRDESDQPGPHHCEGRLVRDPCATSWAGWGWSISHHVKRSLVPEILRSNCRCHINNCFSHGIVSPWWVGWSFNAETLAGQKHHLSHLQRHDVRVGSLPRLHPSDHLHPGHCGSGLGKEWHVEPPEQRGEGISALCPAVGWTLCRHLAGSLRFPKV